MSTIINNMFPFLTNLSRKNKQALLLLFDIVVLISSLFIAFSIRLGYFYFPSGDLSLLIMIFASPLLALPIFIYFGLYHTVIRYVSFKALWNINQATTMYAILWALLAFMSANWEIFPRSVVIINWILVSFSILVSRLFARWILSESYKNNNVLIYGAGSAGRQLSTALRESREYKPIAYIDDASDLHYQSIQGLKVYSHIDLEVLIKKNDIKEVLLAIPSLSRKRRKEIINLLTKYSLVVRSIPSVSDLAKGKVKINDLLEIDIKDLLGRNLASPNESLLKTNILDKVVLVTGAGGSIGSELCRQILFLKPKKLLLYDISESSLYTIEQELKNIGIHNIEVMPIIGSVADLKRMKVICGHFKVQTIYHAAAYKHVPLIEYNISQGILNNVIGTMKAAEAAISKDVETFVLISTDKAVRPTSVMGATKRIAELILQAFAALQTNTCFTMVRFGNVLDSSGSVIPLFKKQISNGGPVTVTHADVVRYFMTIPEAVELVIQSGSMAKGGEVFVLDMGEPIRIYDLAVKMIKLSGLQVIDEKNPKGDIEILYSGLRPGEKLYEELFVGDNFVTTDNKLILRANEEMINWDDLEPVLDQIKEAAIDADTQKSYMLLSQLVPEFRPKNNSTDELDWNNANK